MKTELQLVVLAGWASRRLLARPCCKLCKSRAVYKQQAAADVKQSVCLRLLANVTRTLPAAFTRAACIKYSPDTPKWETSRAE